MIIIGLGSNLGGENFNSPRQVIEAALDAMADHGIIVQKRSRFYETEPVPKSDQPWFVNGVVQVATAHSAPDLLKELHEIEAHLGRTRRVRWEARVIDLDIIAYDDQISPSAPLWRTGNFKPGDMIIPHPRLQDRLFVLYPLRDICPGWRHPVLDKTADEMVIDVAEHTEASSIRLCSP